MHEFIQVISLLTLSLYLLRPSKIGFHTGCKPRRPIPTPVFSKEKKHG